MLPQVSRSAAIQCKSFIYIVCQGVMAYIWRILLPIQNILFLPTASVSLVQVPAWGALVLPSPTVSSVPPAL